MVIQEILTEWKYFSALMINSGSTSSGYLLSYSRYYNRYGCNVVRMGDYYIQKLLLFREIIWWRNVATTKEIQKLSCAVMATTISGRQRQLTENHGCIKIIEQPPMLTDLSGNFRADTSYLGQLPVLTQVILGNLPYS